MQSKKLKITLALFSVGVLSIAGITSVSAIQTSVKDENHELKINKKENLIQQPKTIKNGSSRIEIVFKAGINPEQLQKYVDQIKKVIGTSRELIFYKYVLTLSISYDDKDDLKKLNLLISDLKIDSNDLLQLNVHDKYENSDKEKFVPEMNPLDSQYWDYVWNQPSTHEEPSPTPPPKHAEEPKKPDTSFWDRYDPVNQKRYEWVGLTKEILASERQDLETKANAGNKTKVGLIEASDIIDKNSDNFATKDINVDTSNFEYDPNDPDKFHADTVAEVIIGKQGLNPYVSIYNKTHGKKVHAYDKKFLTRIMESLVKEGVYIQNYTGSMTDSSGIYYNELAGLVDEFISKNPEVIFIIAAGNEGKAEQLNKYGKKIPNMWLRYINDTTLSQNSIIVGSLMDADSILARPSSEYSYTDNYISTSTPDKFHSMFDVPFDGRNVTGNSMSAPTIAAIASILKTNYPRYFDMGADSIIMKSALIAGSRTEGSYMRLGLGRIRWNDSYVYEQQVGFGRPEFSKVKESLLHLDYFKLGKNNTNSNPITKKIYLQGGRKYRFNITWLNDNYKRERLSWYKGPLSLDLDVVTPSNKHTEAKNWFKEQKANTKTVEFIADDSGYYTFNISQKDESRKKDVDVAFTYSAI
ncbi:S8 family serine peptidase [Mycoplasmopsis agassizii]|uniref:Peptidase S8/S53 domain-containing protein n=1 Tax=Mycoplasmopsis agassizii TaxID=33922 RepID=A0ABX4H5A3_9BACT|nr:S8 family serine peptidase [Mycoplasmopsis agassizii]PAF54987.1 hypothetical protein CJF60_04620 [Mycoplasmopsis agassizii]SMC17637.1 Subtilase family protein [Mycoplasmopsis agassizii]